MGARSGGSYAPVMGLGYEDTEVGQGGVEGHENCTWQKNMGKRNEDGRQGNHYEEGRRCGGSAIVSAGRGREERNNTWKTIAKGIVGRRRPTVNLPTEGRMKREATETSRHEKGMGKAGDKADSGEAWEQQQTGMDMTKEEEEMYSSEQEGHEQQRRIVMMKEKNQKNRYQEELGSREMAVRGRREEGDSGGPSDIKCQGNKVKEDYKGNKGRGGNHRGRRRGRPTGNQARIEPMPRGSRRGRKTLKRGVQHGESAYNKNTDEDIQRIIQRMEEEDMQEQSDPEMYDWEYLLTDLGNTRGRLSLYKHALHIYWVRKRLLAKAME